MEAAHYLHFGELGLNTSIYRYIGLNDLYRLFADKQNGLRQPGSWADPFENYILNSYISNGSNEPGRIAWRDKVYAQCWTLESDSDAMWQIFCRGKPRGLNPGVRIRTTIKKLADSLASALPFGEQQLAFIGQVQYLQDSELLPRADALFHGGVNPQRVAESLLIKRQPFRHEREVRVVTQLFWAETQGVFFHYGVDPHHLIDGIIIDPRVPKKRAERLKVEIRERTGYQGQVLWSVLYDYPSYMRLHIWDEPS